MGRPQLKSGQATMENLLHFDLLLLYTGLILAFQLQMTWLFPLS